jgi:hypothetical protein
MKSENTFPGVNLKSPLIIFFLIFLIAYFLLFIFFAIIVPAVWIKFLLFGLSLLSPLTILYAFTTKVIIDADTLTKKTFIGAKTIRLRDVKKYGVFRQGLQTAMPISRTDYNKKFKFDTKMIYMSCSKEYNPIFSFNEKGILRFHYTKEIFNVIENRLLECNKQVINE